MSFVKKHILINGIDTSYGMYGDVINSQTLVFLHGWGQDMNSFRDIFALCEEKTLSYITIDLPGFGGTPYLREAWDV